MYGITRKRRRQRRKTYRKADYLLALHLKQVNHKLSEEIPLAKDFL